MESRPDSPTPQRETSQREAVQLDNPDPDRKDWTWTLRQPCPECGLAVGEFASAEVSDRLFVAAEEWVAILRSSPAVVARPEPRVWSPLEYGAHVRDVLIVMFGRVRLMLDEDEPEFANWDQDAAALEGRYAEADPELVADRIEEVAGELVGCIGGLSADELARPGRRAGGSEFTVLSLLRYCLHDVVHHLWDVTGQLDAAESLELA